jgi:hypothetical protein
MIVPFDQQRQQIQQTGRLRRDIRGVKSNERHHVISFDDEAQHPGESPTT